MSSTRGGCGYIIDVILSWISGAMEVMDCEDNCEPFRVLITNAVPRSRRVMHLANVHMRAISVALLLQGEVVPGLGVMYRTWESPFLTSDWVSGKEKSSPYASKTSRTLRSQDAGDSRMLCCSGDIGCTR